MSGRKQAHSEATLRKRFQAEEQQAIDAVARWVGHPAVRGVIERRRVGAETVVMPIERMLTGQVQVIRFCWHVFGLAGIEPGWELRTGKPWLLTVSEMNAIDRVEADFRGVVQMAVNELGRRGRSRSELDRRPCRGRGAPAPRRRMGSASAGTSGGAAAAGDRRDPHRCLWHDPPARHRGARQQQHRCPAPQLRTAPLRRRRQALAKVLAAWPDVTASRIFATFGDYRRQRGGLARSPGGYLRQLLEEAAEPGEIVRCPSKSTLHEDLKALRAGTAYQKVSG